MPNGTELKFSVRSDGRPARRWKRLTGYLDTVGLDHGALLIFDQRRNAAPVEVRSELTTLDHAGRTITVIRLYD